MQHTGKYNPFSKEHRVFYFNGKCMLRNYRVYHIIDVQTDSRKALYKYSTFSYFKNKTVFPVLD